MKDKIYSITHSEDAVINIEFEGRKQLFSHPTHLFKDFFTKLRAAVSYNISDDERKALVDEGLNCRILEVGSSTWKSGKIRMCLQFIPDEEEVKDESIEFPLDEIRQTLNGVNSIDG